MIETTLGALVEAEPALEALGGLKLSARHAYHVAKLARLVTVEAAHFREARDACIRELGTPREAGGFEITPTDAGPMQAYTARVTELAAVPVTIAWAPLTIAMLGTAEVSAADLLALGPLLADDPESGAP